MTKAFVGLFALTLLGQNAVTGVQIRDVYFDVANSTVTYQIVNLSHKRATGWTIREYGRMGSDATVRSMGTRSMTIGAGPAAAPRMTGTGPLEPNEIRKIVERIPPMPGPEITGRELRLVAVVYEDGSMEGEPEALKEYQERRSSQQGEASRWTTRIQALTSADDIRAALRKLHDDIVDADAQGEKALFDAPSQSRTHFEGRMIRQNLLNQLRGMARRPDAELKQAVLDLMQRIQRGELR